MLLRTAKAILLLFLLISATIAAFAHAPDARLIALVPPESEIVAGMRTTSPGNWVGGLLVVTLNNRLDLEDFTAITGADTSRMIQEAVFLASTTSRGMLAEHSLLVRGHFTAGAIFASARRGGATAETYRGLAVLEVPALARERSTFDEVRWLAILDSTIAVFGSVASVQQELDRYLAKSPPDGILVRRLSQLGSADDAWSLFPAPSASGVLARVLEKLDPKLGVVSREGGSMQYGIRFCRHVEITASANVAAPVSRNGQNGEFATPSTPGFSLLPSSSGSAEGESDRVMVKVPVRRYKAWLAEFSQYGFTGGQAFSH